MLRFTWISPSPLNEGNDETFLPNGNYLVSVRDFLLSQYLQMNLHQSCLLIRILLYPRSISPVALGCFLSCLLQGEGGWKRACNLVRCDSLPFPQDIPTIILQEKTGKLKSRITLQMDPCYPLFILKI